VELAPKWEIGAVLDALRDRNRPRLAKFIERRYETRFFEPISLLEKAAVSGISWKKGDSNPSEPIHPYGFAIMSLACQMIETMESYRRGIPTTNKDDFRRIMRESNYPRRPSTVKCAETDIPGTGEAFKSFFVQHRKEFPGIDGGEFFTNVRSGLLHQSQTRNGLVINIHHPEEALSKINEVLVKGVLYRDSFVAKLHACFVSYLADLRENQTDNGKWKLPQRKIWWIAWLSDSGSVLKWAK
jgi:hypothetical protein